MKNQLPLLIAFCFIFTHAFSQEAPKVKFEKVSEEEMKMTVYEPDSTAEAVILFDDGYSEVKYENDRGFMLRFNRFVRIKILKQTGTEWANFAIPLYSYQQNKEEIIGVKGVTFNLENGKVAKTEMKKESVFKERENKYWEKVRLSLPSVKVGSVIDLKYTVTSPLLWNLHSWEFQYSIPVQWSQYEVAYPEYFNYNQSSWGYYSLNSQNHLTKNESINFITKVDVSTDAKTGGKQRELVNNSIPYVENIYQYSAKNVPALKEEPYLTTLDNYTTKVKFELASVDLSRVGGMFKSYTNTWNDIAQELLADDDFGSQINSANFAKSEIAGLVAGKTDDKQKVNALYNFIQHSIKWNGSKAYRPSKPLKRIFDEKNGNSADVNLLLNAMLNEAGIEAFPVLLSTRDNGIISFVHPTLSDCNYVIVKAMVDGTQLLLDATEPNMPAGLIPFRCLNGPGRVIKKDNAEEVKLANVKSGTNTIVSIELKEGQFKGSIFSRETGLNAFDFRESVKEAGGQNEYFETMKNKSTDIQIDEFSISNLDSLYLPIVKKYSIVLQNETETDPDADILYFHPILVDRTTTNPFSSPTREYPIDFGVPSSDIYQLTLVVPDGYQVEELPKNKSIALEGKSGSYIYQATQVGNNVSFSTRLNIDKTLFLPSEYKMLQDFYNMIVAKESEQLVLKKISQ